MPHASSGFEEYLTRFHAERAGITEQVLLPARDQSGQDPYGWLAEAVPSQGSILDVACGSAPLCPRFGARYVGVDRSAEELAIARRRCPEARFVQGDATELLPADVVICSMALQILTPLPRVLHAIAGALRPGGRLVATAPDTGALTMRDTARWLRLLAALGTRIRSPNDLGALRDHAAAVGLDLEDDSSRRFVLPLPTPQHARQFVTSLYLPGVGQAAVERAVAVAERWPNAPISIRRVVATRRA